MKFRYYVMGNPPHKRLPRKVKKRIQRMIKAGYPNKYSSAKIAIYDFHTAVNRFHIGAAGLIRDTALMAKFQRKRGPTMPTIQHTMNQFERAEFNTVSVPKTT